MEQGKNTCFVKMLLALIVTQTVNMSKLANGNMNNANQLKLKRMADPL
jgi:hypothetical protein